MMRMNRLAVVGLALTGLMLVSLPGGAADPVTWDAAAARHLLSRTSFGGSPEQARDLAGKPLAEAIKQLLDQAEKAAPPARPAWVRDTWINPRQRFDDMSAEEYLVLFRRANARVTEETADLRAWWLAQMIRTEAPLRENMTLFWHGHFTSATGKVTGMSEGFYHQNATWRKHALGNFRQFLEAVTLDPAMLIYLDMEESNKEHPNENYARELLELFTLGVGNYTEKDILETARALTGWTLDISEGAVRINRKLDPTRARSVVREGLVPTFVKARHDDGVKTILGRTGKFGMKDVLDIIVAQPACGRHLANRLIAYFGAYDPNNKLRDRMAEAFRDSKYEIRPMLEVLFTSPEFYAPEARGSQVKSPVRLLVGACRELRLQGEITPALAELTVPLGQELLNPPTVKGWPGGKSWVSASTLTLRYRFGEVLIDGQELTGVDPLGRSRGLPLTRDPALDKARIQRLMQLDKERKEMTAEEGLKVRFAAERLGLNKLADSPEKLADALLAHLIVTKVRPATRAALVEACASVPAAERVPLAVKLILASPEYQLD